MTYERLVGILDANGIIGLAKAEVLEQLPRLFSEVLVPPLVVQEIQDPLSRSMLAKALQHWLKEQSPTPTALAKTPPMRSDADRQLLALALDYFPRSILLTGDRGLIRKAKRWGIPSISAPRIVQVLVELGLLPSAKPFLDRMRERHFGIPAELYEEILRALGEERFGHT